jgi:oligopeptide/dipeptide ABC transporter ATP-binding protein
MRDTVHLKPLTWEVPVADEKLPQPLLAVEGLKTYVDTPYGTVRAVDGISFQVGRGERLAIVGESGSGKTFTAMSITRLLPPNASIIAGSVTFAGADLTRLSQREMTSYRGAEIATIFQDPVSSLNPLRTIGRQVAESLVVHSLATRREAKQMVPDLLAEVGLREPAAVAKRYPFELSGGMVQRVAIAVALACRPKLLIADEPTTALDPTLQVQVLDLLERLCAEREMAVIMITHDMGVVRRFAQRVIVVYAGRMVEQGPIDQILGSPEHPYTQGLLAAIPGVNPRNLLPTIPGTLQSLVGATAGCLFEPRCHLGGGNAICRAEVPIAVERVSGHKVACHLAGQTRHSAQDRPTNTERPNI